jgi:hypothetical protein
MSEELRIALSGLDRELLAVERREVSAEYLVAWKLVIYKEKEICEMP